MMKLKWVQNKDSYESQTEFGTYEITLAFPHDITAKNLAKVRLVSATPGAYFIGTHDTITKAADAAQADFEYRTHILELL